MKAFVVKVAVALLCVLACTNLGTKGQQFASDQSMKDYAGFATGLGSLIGGIEKDDKPDIEGITRSLNRMASMMQSVTGPNGAPPFVDEKYFTEIEQVFTRMGPYVCLLPQTTPKWTADLSPVLGGMIGGLIGAKIAEERLRRQKDAASQISMMSGIGTIAGALGGLSGWEVTRGRFGRPNASVIIRMVPDFVKKMGNMKSMLKGSFKPLSEKKHNNLKLLVERDLAKALRKMSMFINEVKTSFKGNQSEATVEAKKNAFDLRFHSISSELADMSKSVSSMAGVYGGIIGYIMPRYDEDRSDASVKKMGNHGDTSVSHSNGNNSVKTNVTEVKKSLEMMRAFDKGLKGRTKIDNWNVFGGALDDIADSAGEIGGYSGIVGGMMAEVLANGAAAQIRKFLHWDINEEEDTDDPNGPKITKDDVLDKLGKTLPKGGLNRLDYDQKRCIELVAIGLEHFGRLHKYGDMLPGSLHFIGPYGDESKSVSTLGMQRRLIGNQWGGDWKKLPMKKELVNSVDVKELGVVINEKDLEDNAIISFLNKIVEKDGEGSEVVKLLTGKVAFTDAKNDDVQAISVEALAALKSTVIEKMSAENLVSIITSRKSARNPAVFKQFLKSVTDQQINDALVVIKEQQDKQEWFIHKEMATVIADDLMDRFQSDGFSKLCPFAAGITAGIIKRGTADLYLNTDILNCMKDFKDDLSATVKEAIVNKAMESDSISVERIDAMRGFTDEFEVILWFILTPQQLAALMNKGHFLALKNVCPRKRKDIMAVLKKRMNISSSEENSAQYVRNLGEIICGLPPSELAKSVPSDDLKELQSNWTNNCITEPNKRLKEQAKDCSKNVGTLTRNRCNKIRKMIRPSVKKALNNHKWTRTSVRKGLSNLKDELPLAVSYSIDGLTSSEISNIPDAVLDNSLDIVSKNMRISPSQQRQILQKVLNAGQTVDTVDNLKKIGNLLAAVDLSSVEANLVNKVLTESPLLLMQFSKTKKVFLLYKLFDAMTAEELINAATPLSFLIPTSKLRALSSLNMTAISDMQWTTSQAIELVDKYKTLNSKTALDMDDVKELGKAASGITCDDVAKLPLSSMVSLSRLVDNAAGDKISSSLANCIATKLYLCIKMDCVKRPNMNSLVSKYVPGNILIFLPSTVLAHAAYGKHCVSLVRKLGQANIDLLPPGSGHLAIEGLLQVAKICFDSMEEKHVTSTSGGTGFNGAQEEHGGFGNQHNSTQRDSEGENAGKNEHSRKRRDSDKGSDGQGMSSHRSEAVKDDKYERDVPQLSSDNVVSLGRLACSLKKFSKTFSSFAMVQFSKALPMCIGRITKKRKEEINAMFKKHIGDFDEDYRMMLDQLGPIIPLIDLNFIENNISATVAAVLMQNLPANELKMYNKQGTVGDVSTKTLTFEDNLEIVTTKKTTELDLDYKLFDVRAFADVIFPKLIDYVITKNKTGKDPAEIDITQMPGPGDQGNYSGAQYQNSSFQTQDQPSSRKKRQVQANDSTSEAPASEAAIVESSGDDNLDEMKPFPENGVTYELLILAGPAIIGLEVDDIESMDEEMFKDSIPLMGRHSGWSAAQLDAIESKMSVYGKSSTWSNSLLQDLGHLVIMLDATSIEALENLDLETLGSFSRVKWPSNSVRQALLSRYAQLKEKEVAQLNGIELVAAGDLLCGMDTTFIPDLSDNAIKFAFASFGKRKCFDEETRLAFKKKALAALNLSVKNPSVLSELGILAAAMTADEFRSIPPIMSSLLSSNALRVVNAENVINGWNESHFALMGYENGAAIMARPDIFKGLSDKSKNAVFRAAFGSNAGMMSTLIDLMKHGKQRSSTAFAGMFNQMLKSVAMLFNLMLPRDNTVPQNGGPGSVYGLVDPEHFVKPPTIELAFGLSKSDFVGAFNTKFLEDNRLLNFINLVATQSSKLLDVMKGTKSFNDLADEEIKEVPPTVFVGLKVSQLQDMSPKVVGSILDSPKAARDPTSMTKVIRRLDTTQFESAMNLLNKKMKENNGSSTPWKPPIKTQQAMAKNYLERLTKNNSVSDVEVVDKFIENICSIVAGLPPNMINEIPMVESKRKEALDCMGESYKDLSPVQKKQIIKWALQKSNSAKGRTADKKSGIPSFQEVMDLKDFMLDIPVHKVSEALSNPDSALELVENGNLEKLNNLHPNFNQMSKMTIKKLLNNSKDRFDDRNFLDKLGASKCEIPLKKVKNTMSKDTLKYLANYTMSECKDKDTLLEESLEECKGEQALRLQRCQMLQKQASKLSKSNDFFAQKESFNRVGLGQFNMMRELAESLFEGMDLSKMDASEIKNSAGALGGLSPLEMDKLSDSSVLDAMDVIKDNANLSPKQKNIMFKKAQKAGFSLDGESSLMDLGELVSEVPVEDFLKISPENIQKSLKNLMKKASDFSRSQKRAIVGRLENVSMEDMLDDDLGAFAAEIPLKKLRTLQNVNFTKLKNQPWERDQAAELIDNYLNSTDDGKVDVDLISEMGSTVRGLKCSKIMEMEYYEAQEATTQIDSQADMDPDGDECIQSKLHFSNQVEKGRDYMTNDTEEADLETTLEAVPDDVAVFYEPEVVNATPDALCDIIYQKIGKAQLSVLPPGPSDEKLKELAAGAVECLERDPDRDFTVLEEDDVEMLGQLICDVPAKNYKDMSSTTFDSALENMKECLHRFKKDHVGELQTLVKTHKGEASTWDDMTLASLGPMMAMMTKEDIEHTNSESFAESYDDIIPPKIDSAMEAHSLMNYDEFYAKARESLSEEGEDEHGHRRRRQAVRTPTYDNIVALGPGNSGWSVDELRQISDDDILATIDVLGNVKDWTLSKMEVLIGRIETALSQKKHEWTTSVVSDAKHILTDLTAEQISTLDISSLETTTSLSEVYWSSDKRVAAFDVFATKTSTTPETISAEAIAGLGNIFCGMSDIKMSNIPLSIINQALKDLGKLTCYSQKQVDALYSLVYSSNNLEFPSGALLSSMGSIAAGMSTEDLQQIDVEDMPLLSVYAIQLMSPLRFKDGMSNTQLAAAGVTNLAAIIRNKPVYNALSVEQRNTVNTAAYGRSAVIAEEEATTNSGDQNDEDNSATVKPNDSGVTHTENRNVGDVTTTSKATTTSGAAYSRANFYPLAFGYYILTILL